MCADYFANLIPLFTEPQSGHDLLITIKIGSLQVFEETLTLPYHLDKATASHEVMFIDLQVFRDLFDTSRQNRYLSLWAADIVFVDLSQSNRFLLILFANHSPPSITDIAQRNNRLTAVRASCSTYEACFGIKEESPARPKKSVHN